MNVNGDEKQNTPRTGLTQLFKRVIVQQRPWNKDPIEF